MGLILEKIIVIYVTVNPRGIWPFPTNDRAIRRFPMTGQVTSAIPHD